MGITGSSGFEMVAPVTARRTRTINATSFEPTRTHTIGNFSQGRSGCLATNLYACLQTLRCQWESRVPNFRTSAVIRSSACREGRREMGHRQSIAALDRDFPWLHLCIDSSLFVTSRLDL